MSATEIISEPPRLTELDRRAIRQVLLELANRNEDIAAANQSANEGAMMFDRMEEEDARVHPGEVWIVDFGMTAKIRPAFLLTGEPGNDELDLVSVILHTTALRGNRWELSIPKPFLKPGAFHLQQIQTVSTVKLERQLGFLTQDEMGQVLDALAVRLGI